MWKLIAVAVIFGLIISSIAKDDPKSHEQLIFSDDFDQFDTSIWSHEITLSGEGNWEFEGYTNNRSNSYVRSSILYMKPTLTSDLIGWSNVWNGYTMSIWGGVPVDQCTSNEEYGCMRSSQGQSGGNVLNPVQSAKIRSVNTFSFKYGRVEVRAKLPKGDWLWPAIWFLPQYNQYGEWPASGEIDLIESRGNVNYPPGGVDTVSSTLHWGPFYPEDKWDLTHASMKAPSGDFSDNFHVFGLLWTNTSMTMYLDKQSQVILQVPMSDKSFWEKGGWSNATYDNPWQGRGNNAPFDQNFYIIFNLAVGGTNGYFPDGFGKPWNNADPHAMNAFFKAQDDWYSTWNGENCSLQIDYVKVWQL